MRSAVALGFVLIAGIACGDSYGDSGPNTAPLGADAGGDAAVCSENVVYVASNGDDANDGCDKAKPKRTLTAAIGAVQAKGAATTEIRTCAETIRERVVLAYPAIIVGGFACGAWTPGAGRTTLEAPDDKEVETLIAFGAAVVSSSRIEHLRVVGPTRASGYVSAVRVKDGAAPVMKDVELVGGSTGEGISITLAIEGKSSPTIEDSVIKGGRARCTKDCKSAIASTVSIDGGNPKLRRTRIEGSEVDVTVVDQYIGTVTLDVFGGAKATGADAFSELEIVHGIARIAAGQPIAGMRVLGGSEVELVGSKVIVAATPSTCGANPCYGAGASITEATLRVRTSRIDGPEVEGAPGTTGVDPEVAALVANDATADVAMSLVRGLAGLFVFEGSTVDVRGSTLVGGVPLGNEGGTVSVRSSLIAQVITSEVPIVSLACPTPSKTTLESSFVVTAAPNAVAFSEGTQSACDAGGAFKAPADAVAGSNAKNQFIATNTGRTACAGTAEECLLSVFAATADAKLKDGVACAIAQGGLAFPDVTSDLFGAPRTMPFAMGVHEYDGTCSP